MGERRPVLDYLTKEESPPDPEGESFAAGLFMSVVAALLVLFFLSALFSTVFRMW